MSNLGRSCGDASPEDVQRSHWQQFCAENIIIILILLLLLLLIIIIIIVVVVVVVVVVFVIAIVIVISTLYHPEQFWFKTTAWSLPGPWADRPGTLARSRVGSPAPGPPIRRTQSPS